MSTRETLSKTTGRPYVRARPAAPQPRLEAIPPAEAIMEVLSKAGVLFFRFDTSTGVTFLTANVSGFLGYTREELMGDPDIVERVVDPSFLPQLLKMGAGFYVTTPEAIRVSIPFIARSGERVWLETRVVPDISEGGAVVGFLGIALDAPQDAQASLEIATGPRTEPA